MPHFTFTDMVEAVDAMPTHTWLIREHLQDDVSSRSDLWKALGRAEREVHRLRALLEPREQAVACLWYAQGEPPRSGPGAADQG